MGRAPCCDKANVKKGPWSPEEDARLKNFIATNGTGGNWITLPTKAGLRRCGKSCRLRWINYLRPDIKHGKFTEDEAATICRVYGEIGSRWSVIAQQLPGRTDNDIKNFWNTKLKKQLAERGIIFQSQSRLYPQTIVGAGNYPAPGPMVAGGLLQQMLQQPEMLEYQLPPNCGQLHRATKGAGRFEVASTSQPLRAPTSAGQFEASSSSRPFHVTQQEFSEQELQQQQQLWRAMGRSLLEDDEEQRRGGLGHARLQDMKTLDGEPVQVIADARTALDAVNKLVDEPPGPFTDEKLNMFISIHSEMQSCIEQPSDVCAPAQTSPATVLPDIGRYRSPSSSCSVESLSGCNNAFDDPTRLGDSQSCVLMPIHEDPTLLEDSQGRALLSIEEDANLLSNGQSLMPVSIPLSCAVVHQPAQSSNASLTGAFDTAGLEDVFSPCQDWLGNPFLTEDLLKAATNSLPYVRLTYASSN